MTKKILGLDLGTSSIGWALIESDEKPIRIIAMGSRIIPLDSNDRDQFQQGRAITKNQERTQRRTQRKGYDRLQLRKTNLKNLLQKLGIMPSLSLMQMKSLDLWKLRSDAATTAISAEKLGRVLYMLSQKRGYKSARSESNQDKKDTEYVAEVKGRYAQLKDRSQTIGQYLYDELKRANEGNRYFHVKKQVYPREAYIEEFDIIIDVQKKHHSFLTEDVINTLRNKILYYQRKLKSQKGLVSVCDFEGFETTYIDKDSKQEKKTHTGPKVAPKTSPLFQLCKIWETVNNLSLKIKNPEGSKYKWSDRFPTLEEKQKIVSQLFIKETLSLPELLKILNLRKDDVYVNKQISKGLQGNITYVKLYDIIGKDDLLKFDITTTSSKHQAYIVEKKTGEILEELEPLQLDAALEKEPLYQLWHVIYSIKDIEECKSVLVRRFGLEEAVAEKLAMLDFNKQAFGNKSSKAIRKILPYLMKGYNYTDACTLAGYNHSNSITKKESQLKRTFDKLDLIPKNGLRQPVVEKILNQMINVVNAIIHKYGKPQEIKVELARELKQSKDEREEAEKANTLNKNLNAEIEKRLKELGLPETKRYIQKYKFIFPSKDKKWKEAQVVNQCIYCGDHFNISEALGGDNFDVDHIIPKALLFDDSQTNKVLVHRICNANKTNQTAYDYIAGKGREQLDAYVSRIDDWYRRGILSYGKMQRLKTSYEEYLERKRTKKETEADKRLWENFIDRQIRETQYIAKKSREILQKVCNNVTATEGSVTAKLRQLWGWDDILMNLQLPKYKVLEQTHLKEWTSDHGKRKHHKEVIMNWSKRDDHRHHAIDALAIACTQQGFIQRINTLNSSETKSAMKAEIDSVKAEYGNNAKRLKETNEIIKNYSEKLTQLEEYLISKRPFSTSEIMEEADKILVSFKSGKKVATSSKFKARGKNMEKGVIVPRGPLHEQFVYGQIKVREAGKSVKYLFGNPTLIVDNNIRSLIEERLGKYGGDMKTALASLKKNPIYLDQKQENILEKADCYKNEYVIKYKLQDLRSKDVPFIIDEKVRELVQKRLNQFNGKEKEAFKDTLWFNKENQIPINTIRCYTGLTAVEAIKKDGKGKDIGFAKTGSNHHIAIYEGNDGKAIQHVCTFWHAVERKMNKIPFIIKDTKALWDDVLKENLPQSFLEKLPPDDLKFRFAMQQNEMFLLGLSKEKIEELMQHNDKKNLSKYLYVVWSVSDNQYWFRHHLETKNSELKTTIGAKESLRYYLFKSVGALLAKNPVKIRINHLGEIANVWE